jgi:GxxExxY protein
MWFELSDAGLRVEREQPVTVHFKGQCVGKFRADMIVDSKVLLEFKAGDRWDPHWEAQIINYLRATQLEVGIILHFGQRPRFKRLVVGNDRKATFFRSDTFSP